MRAKIIAEAGSNHGGDMVLAREMVSAAAESGCDYVKFQSWQANRLDPLNPDRDFYKNLELSDEAHLDLMEACRRNNIRFLTTCFDCHRVDFLSSLGLKSIKVASTDVGSTKLLNLLKEHFPHLVVSTGMSFDEEVRRAAETLKGCSYTFLHCVSLYPTPLDKVNMARMDWLRQFTPSVGFSDHTIGVEAGKLAIARGASFVEKHFTVDRSRAGKDQVISASPEELKVLVDYSREVESLMGDANPDLTEEELANRDKYIGRWGDNR